MWAISFFIRQFILPNPFTPLGDNADTINLILGGILIPISYFMVGAFYERGECPALGSLLFLIAYIINSAVIYLICLVFPAVWLMITLTCLYFVLYIFIVIELRNNWY